MLFVQKKRKYEFMEEDDTGFSDSEVSLIPSYCSFCTSYGMVLYMSFLSICMKCFLWLLGIHLCYLCRVTKLVQWTVMP